MPQSPEDLVYGDSSVSSDAYQNFDDFDTDGSEVDDHSNYNSENDYLEGYEAIDDFSDCNLKSIIGNEPSCSTEDEKLIYPNARITNAVSMLLIMSFAITHQLTGAALKDLLSLIDIHCLVPNPLIKSLYKFKQYFLSLKNPLKKHYYCPKCTITVTIDCVVCPNTMCKQQLTQQDIPFFLELSIIDQLKSLFSRKGFYNDLGHRFNRKKHGSNNIEDIYDGHQYKKFMQTGQFLATQNNISFLWNTDGIPVFKSSKFSIWPLYFAINELPLHKRWSSSNIILGGLWFGSQKPNMMTFLQPFNESISYLYSKGVEVLSPDIKKSFICHAMLLCGTCDLPAKAMVYNMTQFNGQYGCSHCLQSGKQLAVGTRGRVHVYPYMQVDPTGPSRTSDQQLQHSQEAVIQNKPIYGVKGPSWLSVIPNYNVIQGNVIDYMHCVLLGVTKMLLKLWFDSAHAGELWYCGTKVQEADSKLLQIRPPNMITRIPRSIQQHRSYWKATEYRSWLLYYSLPVMMNILPENYIAHHMLLVETVATLLQGSISQMMLRKTERLIKHYCFKFPFYYSERYMTANLHHLLHLPEVVSNFGPLFVYSCFPYENQNGKLLKFVKGTQHVDLQIIEAITLSQKLPQIAEEVLSLEKDNEAQVLYHQMTATSLIPENSTKVGDSCFTVGSTDYMQQLPNSKHQEELAKVTSSNNTQIGTFKRALVGRQIIHSVQYTRSKKRNNHTVSYSYNSTKFHGEVQYYVTNNSEIFAIIKPFSNCLHLLPVDDITNCTVPHIHIYSSIDKNNVHAVSLSSIDICVCISFEQLPGTFFVIEQPNLVEKD